MQPLGGISRKSLLAQAAAVLLVPSCAREGLVTRGSYADPSLFDIARDPASFPGSTPLDNAACRPGEACAQSAGIRADGTTPTSKAISALLSSRPTIRAYFGAGHYLIDSTVSVNVVGSVSVRCHPAAIFRLADGARCHMFEFVGNDASQFSWQGGVIDGNDAHQGDGRLDGMNFDRSKGLRVIRHRTVTIGNLRVQSVRGHAINHWNNDSFHAHDLTFDQPIDPIQPIGGRRRDGVTGASTHVLIERLQGFTSDDMVAICAGAPWSGAGTFPASVKSVVVRDVRAGVKWDEEHGQYRRTWHGVALYPSPGYSIDEVSIKNLVGQTQCGHIRAGGYAAVASGTLGAVTIDHVSGRCLSRTGDYFVHLGGTTTVNTCTVHVVRASNLRHEIVGHDARVSILLTHLRADSIQIERGTALVGGKSAAMRVQLESCSITRLSSAHLRRSVVATLKAILVL